MAKIQTTPQKTATQAPPVARPKQIVPLADFIAHGVSPIPNAPAPILTNHGGTVLQSVQVVPVYWGAAWASGTNATLPGQIDGFFDFILTSSLMDLLGEYSLPGKPIQHGSRLPSVHFTNSERTPGHRRANPDPNPELDLKQHSACHHAEHLVLRLPPAQRCLQRPIRSRSLMQPVLRLP